MRIVTLIGIFALGILAAAARPCQASLFFVGSWEVDDGPHWTTNPLVYSGQEAAALLFGGLPTDYVISTVDSIPANVDHMAWYSILGIGGGTKGPESLHKDLGLPGYAGFDSAPNDDWSAYVNDNATGPVYTNYAFRDDGANGAVPEPGAVAVWSGLGLAGLVGAWWRQRRG